MFEMDEKVVSALLLTSMGAAGTALGALLVVLHPKMEFSRLGFLQGLAAGLMLSISMFDLYPAAQEELGFLEANIWFYSGVLFFAAIVAFIPEPDMSKMVVEDDEPMPVLKKSRKKLREDRGSGKAKDSDTEEEPVVKPLTKADREQKREAKKRVLMSGLITAIGIALHNFPEGVAVFLASMKSPAIGLSLALAIALHNVPEGVAVALPVYFATGSRWKGFKYAFVSGLAEPLAVVFLGLLFPTDMSKSLVEKLLAAVGGIMAFLAIHELLPLSIEHAGRNAAVAALFIGVVASRSNGQGVQWSQLDSGPSS
eukprot:gene8617-34060_t